MSTGHGPRFGPRHRQRYGSDAVVNGNPITLLELNDAVAAWGASFSHAWDFNETSGNATDLALVSPFPLVPGSAPPQGVITGLPANDKGVNFTSATGETMACALATSLDVTTGSLFVYVRARMRALPAANYGIVGKGAANYWGLFGNTSGYPNLITYDGVVGPSLTLSVNHVGAGFSDILAIIDRDSGSKLMSLTSELGDAGTLSVATLASLTSTNPFCFGQIAGIASAGPWHTSFAAFGTVPGTLVANRVAAVKRLREVHGAF